MPSLPDLRVSRLAALVLGATPLAACGGWGSGSKWVAEPLVAEERGDPQPPAPAVPLRKSTTKTIGARSGGDAPPEAPESAHGGGGSGRGRVLGTFRNTYYDFPNEADHGGERVALMSASCVPIAKVPRAFYDAVCVQGSGSLARGGTVSFAKRDCSCAEVCPRTGQRICFEALDRSKYPWGRGAAGRPIVPMRSIAADTSVLPMGTVVYIPELDGVAVHDSRTGDRTADGCFVVEDRGLRVQGEHVDIFTGEPSQTAALNALVPSNRGVTLVLEAPKCAHLATP